MKITSKEELLAHIEAHKGEDVPLFSAYKGHSFVSNDTIPSHNKITIKKVRYYDGTDSGHEFLHENEDARHSLHDRHISGTEQTYNDTWWFTTREEAEAYIKS